VKIIILRDHDDEVWLHLNKIQRMTSYNRSVYTETKIYCKDFIIEINDHTQNLNFKQLIHGFLNSDNHVKILKVEDLRHEKNYAFMRATDWISQAMKEQL
jgi:hypothetical protein